MNALRSRLAASILVALLVPGCVASLRRELTPPERFHTLDRRSPYLKAHLRDGRLCVFDRWVLSPSRTQVMGSGELLDPNRDVIRAGAVAAPLDSVALFETNVEVNELPPVISALAIVFGVTLAIIAIGCALDPKACFGSCPTFYVTEAGRPALVAEAFSSSVAPSLAATDIDALYRVRPSEGTLDVGMRNEGLETHVVDRVRLLAAPRPEGGHVFKTGAGEFREARELIEPASATATEGDCATALREFDGIERWSLADSTDLATRETIDLVFADPPAGDLGVVLAARQSLLTTFLFYQTLAYMGRSAGTWIAALERGDSLARQRSSGIGRELGGIEVWAKDSSGVWRKAGEHFETGPLATDVNVVPLPPAVAGPRAADPASGSHARPHRPLEIRLRMTRGLWRLDWVGLARLGQRVEPVRLDPERVLRGGVPDEDARASLLDPGRSLTTLRGDAYTLSFRLPPRPERYELFLESRGYYLEWMREEWLAEENPALAARAFLDPRGTLRALAPEFKRREARMEGMFWGSRYATP